MNRHIYRKKNVTSKKDKNDEERIVAVKSYLKRQQWSSEGITEGMGIESTRPGSENTKLKLQMVSTRCSRMRNTQYG